MLPYWTQISIFYFLEVTSKIETVSLRLFLSKAAQFLELLLYKEIY